MSQSKNVVIAGLALTSIAGVILSWRQHAEIARLSQLVRIAEPAAGPPVTLRNGVGRHVTLVPQRAFPGSREDLQPETSLPGERLDDGMRAAPPAVRREKTIARLVGNPEFIQALDLYRQGTLDARFAALFRQLNLSATELAAFKQLLAEKENVALDVFSVSETSPEGPLSPAGLRQSVTIAQAQVENAILSSLGSDRYAVYHDYEQTIAQRATVAQLEERLSYSRAPLTPAQSESLVRILVASTPAKPAEPVPAISVVMAADSGELTPVVHAGTAVGPVTDEAVTAARDVLAPEQLAALRDIQDEQQAALRASQLIHDTLPAAEHLPYGLRVLLQ